MCMNFSFGERPSVHVSVYGILDPSTQWEFESMCVEFSIGGQIRWSRQCMWSFRSEHIAGICIDVCGILKPWTTARSRPCLWNFQSTDCSTSLLDVYGFFDLRAWWWPQSKCVNISSLSVKIDYEKCLQVWGNAKEKRAIKEQTIQRRRLQHQIETVQTLKPMSQSLLGEINPSASNHLKTDSPHPLGHWEQHVSCPRLNNAAWWLF